MYYIIIKPLQD
uniref:Uncharacterized protein n=1 Tax=Arundo donax TaxID=35708 RepID=A0A0A9H641_ARUDO